MTQAPLKDILEATFRANPEYEVVLFERLPPEQQEYLKELRNEPDFYGVFRPRGESALTMKSAPRDAALLCMTLREPGPLPQFVRTLFGTGSNQAIAELVLDGILEIEDDGGFVSGSQAFQAVYQQPPSTGGEGLISRLSLDALKYAQNLDMADSHQLSARLYFYNRTPASAYWRRTLSSPAAVCAFLGIENGGPSQRKLERYWSSADGGETNGWLHWTARQVPQRTRPGPTYKLYVSPKCEGVRDAFQAAAEALAGCGAFSFKAGRDLHGLLRPDKLVAYFQDFESLERAAAELARRLEGCPAQGVPFTAELPGGGLLSWGVDPPLEEQSFGSQMRESWRLWVTNRLAVALLASKASTTAGIEPWQFALERLRLEDIDTDTWTPAAGIWRGEAAAKG